MIAVRPLGVEDAEAWRALWRGYLEFYETELPETIYRTAFARLTDPAEADYNGLIAHLDGVPVGLAHYIYHRHGWQVDEVCYLQDLFVVPGARRCGAGRALIDAVFAAADAAGRPNVYWLTQEHNAPARRLYDTVGRVTPFLKYQR
jgi:GNAT superfamily N-acetyltransferase